MSDDLLPMQSMITLSRLVKSKVSKPNNTEHKSKLYIRGVNNVKAYIFFRGRGRVLISETALQPCCFVVVVFFVVRGRIEQKFEFFLYNTAFRFLNRVPIDRRATFLFSFRSLSFSSKNFTWKSSSSCGTRIVQTGKPTCN